MKYTFKDYLTKIKNNQTVNHAIKFAWLNPDETIREEFTNDLWDINLSINRTYQNGARSSCTIILNNKDKQFPINYNNIWFNQKFQVWTGIYMEDDFKEPYYFSQGIFVVSNPKDIFNPELKTLTIEGQDKWSLLDGSLGGNLFGSIKNLVGTDIIDAIKNIQKISRYSISREVTSNYADMLDPKILKLDLDFYFQTSNIAIYCQNTGFPVYKYYDNYYSLSNSNYCFKCYLENGDNEEDYTYPVYKVKEDETVSITYSDIINHGSPVTKNVFKRKAPYTIDISEGQSYADLFLEYAKILNCNIYYDKEGFLTLEGLSDSKQDFSNLNKEILDYLNNNDNNIINQDKSYDFKNCFNRIKVVGPVINGKQIFAELRNTSPGSQSSINRIGEKAKKPYEEKNYRTTEQCISLAKYYAQRDFLTPINLNLTLRLFHHYDVNKIVLYWEEEEQQYSPYLIKSCSLSFSPENSSLSCQLVKIEEYQLEEEVTKEEIIEEEKGSADE